MRLALFDRIRRLAHLRRPAKEAASGLPGTQGRHRGGQRRGSLGGAKSQRPSRGRSSGNRERSLPGASGGPGASGWPGEPGGHGWPGEPGGPAPVAGPGRPATVAPAASLASQDPPVSEASFAARTPAAPATPTGPGNPSGQGGSRRASKAAGSPAVRAGSARARIREAPPDATAVGLGEAARPAAPGPRPHWHEAGRPGPAHAAGASPRDTADPRAAELARAAAGVPRQPGGTGRSSLRAAGAALRTRLPFAAPHSRDRPLTADGRRNCGSIERILWRQWDTKSPPPPEVIAAVDRLAELPERIKERLTDGLDAIFIGPGGVPELDEMTGLRGVPLPAGRATWDACAGAYGERKIVVGSQPSPTPDVMCHEVGHALDDLDSPAGKWQSDSAEFRMLYDQCQPHLASDFHRQPGGLGRKEFFADAFAAIASRQRPALVDMLGGDTRTALRVMLYFNRRYGI